MARGEAGSSKDARPAPLPWSAPGELLVSQSCPAWDSFLAEPGRDQLSQKAVLCPNTLAEFVLSGSAANFMPETKSHWLWEGKPRLIITVLSRCCVVLRGLHLCHVFVTLSPKSGEVPPSPPANWASTSVICRVNWATAIKVTTTYADVSIFAFNVIFKVMYPLIIIYNLNIKLFSLLAWSTVTISKR